MPRHHLALGLSALFTVLPASAIAQTTMALQQAGQTRGTSTPNAMPESYDTPAAASTRALKRQPHKDSLWNGVLAGSIVGGLAGAVVGANMCSECAGFYTVPVYGLVGAGLGAGIGAGIDALLNRSSPFAARPRRAWRASVSPALGTGVRGVTASMSF